MSKKTKWVQFVGGVNTQGKVFKDIATGNEIKGLIYDHDSEYWYGYCERTGMCDGYPISRIMMQVEVSYLYQTFNTEQYKLIEWEVVNRDGDLIPKQDILIGSKNICYKDEHGQILVVYLNGRQNIQEVHFSDLLLRKEV